MGNCMTVWHVASDSTFCVHSLEVMPALLTIAPSLPSRVSCSLAAAPSTLGALDGSNSRGCSREIVRNHGNAPLKLTVLHHRQSSACMRQSPAPLPGAKVPRCRCSTPECYIQLLYRVASLCDMRLEECNHLDDAVDGHNAAQPLDRILGCTGGAIVSCIRHSRIQ